MFLKLFIFLIKHFFFFHNFTFLLLKIITVTSIRILQMPRGVLTAKSCGGNIRPPTQNQKKEF